MRAPSLTVGIEEEYQIIDPVTRDLTPGFDALVTSEHAELADVKAELHQCQVEIGTKVCQSIAELRQELTSLRGLVT
ncbi:MAG: glutamate-cysteine ligase family protein, partial [Gemmatimonas sp.]